jgi:hypothetical protein
MVRRVPEVEVVVVHAHAHEVPGPGLLVERHEAIGVPLLGLPQRDDVLVPLLGRVSVVVEMVLVLPVPLLVHAPGVPVAGHRHRLRPPVRPDPELRVAEPLGAAIRRERLDRWRKRALRDRLGLRLPATSGDDSGGCDRDDSNGRTQDMRLPAVCVRAGSHGEAPSRSAVHTGGPAPTIHCGIRPSGSQRSSHDCPSRQRNTWPLMSRHPRSMPASAVMSSALSVGATAARRFER